MAPHPIALVAAALLASVTGAQAQDAFALRARSLAATCSQCHGTDGRVPPGSAMVALAGKPATYLVEQMSAFKNGTRSGTVMPQIAKGYSDAQIDALAAYFSGVPAGSAP